jgi:hypothetical protein
MAKNSICDFGWKARDFALKGIDGETYTLLMSADRRARSLFSSAITVHM